MFIIFFVKNSNPNSLIHLKKKKKKKKVLKKVFLIVVDNRKLTDITLGAQNVKF